MGTEVCKATLFVHTLLVCDNTSRLFGIDNGEAYSKDEHLRQQAVVFMEQNTKEDVVQAGTKALICMYNGKPDDELNSLRHRMFNQKVATSTKSVPPQTLPPTEAAAMYHSMRVYN